MSLYLYSILIFFSFFPTWFLKFKVFEVETLLPLLFFIILSTTSFIIVFSLKKFNKKKLLYFFTTLVILYGLDNHLSLHRELTNSLSFLKNIFGGPYYSSLLLLVILFLILLSLNFLLKENAAKILTAVILSIFISSLFDNKSITNLKNFSKEISSMKEDVTVVLIFDEMSGINSYESKTKKGEKFDQLLYKIAKKHNLILFSNVQSKFSSTIKSVGSLVNLNKISDFKNLIKVEKSNFHYNNSFLKNELFNTFQSVAVFQSTHINFCNNSSVKKCQSFNPFKKKKIYFRL